MSTKSIGHLLSPCETDPLTIISSVYGANPRGLTSEEIETLKQRENAASNAFAAAITTVRIIGDFLYSKISDGKAIDADIGGEINDASWAISFLNEILESTHDIKSSTQSCLLKHYEHRVEQIERQFQSANAALAEMHMKRRKGARP